MNDNDKLRALIERKKLLCEEIKKIDIEIKKIRRLPAEKAEKAIGWEVKRI